MLLRLAQSKIIQDFLEQKIVFPAHVVNLYKELLLIGISATKCIRMEM